MFQLFKARNFMNAGLVLFFITLLQPAMTRQFAYARDYSSSLQISYKNNQLNISARDVDIKKILLQLAAIADIYIRFPASIEKQITVNRRGISLKKALQSLLRGFNHVIVYRRIDDDRSRIEVDKVFVFPKSRRNRRRSIARSRTAYRIKSYERRIETLKKRLLKIDPNSSRGKNYARRIQFMQERIDDLQR
jgi:hypothetical protein